MKRHITTFFLFFFVHFAYTQNAKLSDEPTQFIADVKKMMGAVTNLNYARATRKIDSLWIDSRLTATQQKSIIGVSQHLAARGYKASVQFQEFFNSIYSAFNSPNANLSALDSYLSTAQQVADVYDGKNILKYFESGHNLFENRLLYNTNFNKLYVRDGTYSFRMSDATAELIKTVESSKASSSNDPWTAIGDSSNLNAPVFYQKKMIPEVAGAIVEFKNVSLNIVTANDSVFLTQTSGKLAIKESIWIGTGGKFTWEVLGDPKIYVNFGLYSFNITNPKISADDATLHYDDRLSKPIDGLFEYESKRRPKGQTSSFPRFISYQNNANFRSLSKNVIYKGGISLIGLKQSSVSLSSDPASITVMKNGKVAFKANSKFFDLNDTLITSNLASFVTYIGGTDSLTHAGIRLSYSEPNGMLKCQRADKTGYKYAPYLDSYHKVFIEAEMLRWSFSKNELEFLMVGGRTVVPVKLESFNYFKPERYRAISADYSFHPLAMAANYMSKQKAAKFFPEDLAAFYKKDVNLLRGALNQMVLDGYMDTDGNGQMTLNRKGILYVLANTKEADFDNLQISSLFAASEKTANASINLVDNIMTIRGVEQFVVSDSLKIFAYPSDKQIRMLKNRDFWLNGILKSANFKFTGRDLLFNYDKFFVDLNKIDNITFIPKAVYDKGGNTEVGGDVVYEKSGRIYLNDAKNKSGKTKNSVFPRLTVPEGMTVYFDQPDRGNLIYNRKVYFKIPSFDYDSLGINDITFIGNFYSDGIFPPFPAQLKSMPDNSLGFVYTPPTAGYKVYGTNTNIKFAKELVMDKQGLRSQGEISHLSARIPTQAMLFMTDSLIASGAEAEIKEATIGHAYFPKVDLRNYTLRWSPKLDSMALTTKGNTFNFYNGSTKLEGLIVLRSSGLYGNGFLKRADSELTSQDIKFKKEGFLAMESQYKILATENNIKSVLLGKTVDVDFNIVKGMVNISTHSTLTENSSLEFPIASYRTSISRAQWNVNAKTIAMKGDVNTSSFTATAPEQFGLTFNGSAALYEIERMTLNISGVPYIKAADAKVLPDKGLVVIRRNGEMQPFQNARLLLDTLNEYHRLKNGNIEIASRNKFSGDATYLYTTVLNDTIPVKMGNFEIRQATLNPNDSKKQASKNKTSFTVARAEIAESDNFIIAPKLQYKGRMTMLAPEPNLQFDGYVKPLMKRRINLIASWVPFKENPTKDVKLKITPALKNEAEQLISVGLHYRASTGVDGIYATFLSTKESRNDQTIFTANGLMGYDEKTKLFKIVPETKTVNELIDEESTFSFNDLKGTMSYQGKLNLLYERAKEGEEIFLSSGAAQISLDSSNYRFNALMAMNFPASSSIISKIAEGIVQSNLEEQHSDPAEPDWDRLSTKLSPLIGKKQAESYVNRAAANYKPLSDASPKMAATIVLSTVNLRWSPTQNAFYSVGKLGVANLGNTDINAQMEGMLEIRKNQRGDEVSLYIESSPEVWYFFDWQGGKLAMVSSVQEHNDLLTAKSKGEKKEPSIVPMSLEERNMFVDRFASLYRPKPPKKATAKNVLSKAATNPKTTAKPNTAEEKKTAAKEPKVVAEETQIVAKDSAKTTTKTKPGTKVVQSPTTKPTTKPKKKEEEKEGF